MYNPSCGLDAPSGEDVFFFDVRMWDAKLLKMRRCADVKYQRCEDAPCILEKLWWFILGSRRLECQPSRRAGRQLASKAPANCTAGSGSDHEIPSGALEKLHQVVIYLPRRLPRGVRWNQLLDGLRKLRARQGLVPKGSYQMEGTWILFSMEEAADRKFNYASLFPIPVSISP